MAKKAFAIVVRVHARCWQAMDEHGLTIASRRTRTGAIQLVRAEHPGLPVRVLAQGEFYRGKARLTPLETLPA